MEYFLAVANDADEETLREIAAKINEVENGN